MNNDDKLCDRCGGDFACWWIEELDEFWCRDCRDYLLEIDPWIVEDRKKEIELSKSNWVKMDDNNIMVPYELIVKADQMLFLVGQHGKAVLDDNLREQMIKCASELRKIFMNMKGE